MFEFKYLRQSPLPRALCKCDRIQQKAGFSGLLDASTRPPKIFPLSGGYLYFTQIVKRALASAENVARPYTIIAGHFKELIMERLFFCFFIIF